MARAGLDTQDAAPARAGIVAMTTDEEYLKMFQNLLDVQTRCNELLEEARLARSERESYRLVSLLLAEELQLTRDLLEDAVQALEGLVAPKEDGPVN
jgi:hypothetical protein